MANSDDCIDLAKHEMAQSIRPNDPMRAVVWALLAIAHALKGN